MEWLRDSVTACGNGSCGELWGAGVLVNSAVVGFPLFKMRKHALPLAICLTKPVRLSDFKSRDCPGDRFPLPAWCEDSYPGRLLHPILRKNPQEQIPGISLYQ